MSDRKTRFIADRFVPLRSASVDSSYLSSAKTQEDSTQCSDYERLIRSTERRLFEYSRQRPLSPNRSLDTLKDTIFFSNIYPKYPTSKSFIVQASSIIDAPNVVDNYYHNVLDWSTQQAVGVGLGCQVYLRLSDGEVVQIAKRSLTLATSVRFHAQGSVLYVGEDSGHLEIYDLMRNKCVRSIKAHYDRIGCIENISHSVFLTGSKDRCVKEYDIRLEKPLVGCFLKHEGEICGMSAMDQAIASGSNDNKVLIWDLRSIETVMNVHRHHSGAVKAIKWCPWRSNVLATGGGNKDRQVILWNSLANEVEERLDVKSQVTSLGWRSATKELVTSHSGNRNGYALIWDTKSKKLTHKLIGQSRRMLSLVLNPNNENELCSLGADETMRFWVIKSNREQPHRKLDDQSHLVASNYLVK